MKRALKLFLPCFLFLVISAFFLGCAPGPESKFVYEPAGFWAGLWHGLISFFTFLISLFTDSVTIYEVSNNGSWYNFGFILGICIFYSGSGGGGAGVFKKFRCSAHKEWDAISNTVEEKIERGIKEWLKEFDKKDEEWEEIGRKIEEKIKRILREWAEK